MDIQALSATQMANIIRLEVFMDNHQTQGYLMKTITKLLVQLEVTKMQNAFKHTNAQMYRENVDRFRTQSMPFVNDEMSFPVRVFRFDHQGKKFLQQGKKFSLG